MKNHKDRFSTCWRLPGRFYRNVHPIPPSLTVVFFRRSPCYAIPSTVGKIPWRRFRIFVTSTSPCILWKRVSKNLWLTSFERCWRWWFFGPNHFFFVVFALFFFCGWRFQTSFVLKTWSVGFLNTWPLFWGGDVCFFCFFWDVPGDWLSSWLHFFNNFFKWRWCAEMHSGGGQHKFSSSPLERFLSEVGVPT